MLYSENIIMEFRGKAASEQSAPKTFFSQLQHLAAEVDKKVHIVKEEMSSRKFKQDQCQEQSTPNLFLMNSQKEIDDRFKEVKAKYEDFEMSSVKFGHLQDLLKTALDVHEKRMEKLQTHMESYGYVKPIHSVKSDIKNDSDSHPGIESVHKSDNDESTENQNEKESQSVSSTPQSKTNADEQFVRRTPKFEDIYNKLSENTILLLKHSSYKADNSHLEESDHSTKQLTCNSPPSLKPITTLAEPKFTISLSSKENLSESFLKPKIQNTDKFERESTRHCNDKYLSSMATPCSADKHNDTRKMPQLEDIYGMLSENTISLLKYSSCKSVSEETLSENTMTGISNSYKDTLVFSEQTSFWKPEDRSLSETSLLNFKTNVLTEKTTTLGTSGLKPESHIYKYSQHEKAVPKCAKSLTYTTSTKAFDSMPEPPKLLSKDLIKDIYNNRY
ncbi:hypothetical protein Btru_072980 [Bulinus truncatus]|nr:hypothetical protein Btru_072980 [Bulinus truncatus]